MPPSPKVSRPLPPPLSPGEIWNGVRIGTGVNVEISRSLMELPEVGDVGGFHFEIVGEIGFPSKWEMHSLRAQ